MEEFKIRFKPLQFKATKATKKTPSLLELSYIYKDTVYVIAYPLEYFPNLNVEVQNIENIMLLFGGYEKIKEVTEYLINEEKSKAILTKKDMKK